MPGELKQGLQNQQAHQNNCRALQHPGLLTNSSSCPLSSPRPSNTLPAAISSLPASTWSPAWLPDRHRCSPRSSLAGISPSPTGTMELFLSPLSTPGYHSQNRHHVIGVHLCFRAQFSFLTQSVFISCHADRLRMI